MVNRKEPLQFHRFARFGGFAQVRVNGADSQSAICRDPLDRLPAVKGIQSYPNAGADACRRFHPRHWHLRWKRKVIAENLPGMMLQMNADFFEKLRAELDQFLFAHAADAGEVSGF